MGSSPKILRARGETFLEGEEKIYIRSVRFKFFFHIHINLCPTSQNEEKKIESDTPNVDFSSPSKKVSPPALRIFGEESK